MKTVKLNSLIYDKNAILSGIRAYADLCYIELNRTNKYFICTFLDCKYDEDITAAEFENYVIDIMNCK